MLLECSLYLQSALEEKAKYSAAMPDQRKTILECKPEKSNVRNANTETHEWTLLTES